MPSPETPPPDPFRHLTRRQRSVARLIAQAATSKQIAAILEMTDGNVEKHVGNIARLWGLDLRRNLRVQIALHVERFRDDAAA